MAQLLRVAGLCLAVLLLASPAMAQEAVADGASNFNDDGRSLYTALGKSIGAGMVILGAGLGIGRIGGMAVEAMSRQPEVAPAVQTGMIIAAALIEGATFFALLAIAFFI